MRSLLLAQTRDLSTEPSLDSRAVHERSPTGTLLPVLAAPPELNVDEESAEDDPFIVEPEAVSKYKLLLQTLCFASFVVISRFLIQRYTGWNGYIDLRDLGLVYTGLFFTTGVLFSNVNADLKESERIPADFTCSMEQLTDMYTFMQQKGKDIAVEEVYLLILKIMVAFKKILNGEDASVEDCFKALAEVPVLASNCDMRGGPGAGFMNAAADKARRAVARANVVSRTDVLPSAHGLLHFFVLASTVILFLGSYSSWVAQICIMTCVYTVTWFNVRIISFIDDPFDSVVPLGWTCILGNLRQVQTFPLDDFAIRILKKQNLLATLRGGPAAINEYFGNSVGSKVFAALEEKKFVEVAFLVQLHVNSRKEGKDLVESSPTLRGLFQLAQGDSVFSVKA